MSQDFAAKVAAMKGSGVELDLPTLIALARSHEMTREELEAQRKSWVVAELLLTFPKMRRNRAEALYEEVRKEKGL